MKTSLVCSTVLHLICFLLLALAPNPRAAAPVVEKIISVNLVSFPAMPAPAAGGATASPGRRRDGMTIPAPPPKTVRRRQVILKELPELTQLSQPVKAPEPVSPLETPAAPESTLKEKVQARLKTMGQPLPPLAMPVSSGSRPAEPNLKERVEARLRLSEPPPSARPPATAGGSAPAAGSAPSGLTFPLSPPGLSPVEGAVFPHAWYISIVQNKIYENWSPPQRVQMITPGGGTTIRFKIVRRGTISDVAIRTPSGYSLFDRSAEEAIRSVRDLPPLPADYDGEYLYVVVFFQPQT